MKKLLALLLALSMVFALVACAKSPVKEDDTKAPISDDTKTDDGQTDDEQANDEQTNDEQTADQVEEPEAMTYEEYVAAELDSEVTVKCYVQATQSWWDDKITVYAQDADGAYFMYELACSKEDAAKLTAGTKILVKGYKAEWAGEVEIIDATFEFIEGVDPFVAEPLDVTDLLGTEDLIQHQNKKVSFKGLTIENIEYKNGEPGDDIYVTVKLGENTYNFCVERYLTGPDTDVYKAFAELKAGDVVDMEGFLYWYEGVNTHITAVAKAA